MNPKKHRGRIEIIDIAKCIAIFMVVLGHTASNAELLGDPPMLIKILYSIHMPLFFFLSGLSISLKPFKDRQEWFFFFRKTVLTIVIPYLLWALLYCNFNFENVAWILYGSWNTLGKTGTVTSLWYLPCLFLARILTQLVISAMARAGKEQNRLLYLPPAAVCLVIGVILPDIEIGYPWCFNIAFVAAGCILAGISARHGLIKLSVQKGWLLILLLAVTASVYALTVCLTVSTFEIMMMCRGAWGNPFLALILAVLGGFAVMVLSIILKRLADEWLPDLTLKPLTYLGQHTMGIFLLHKPMLQILFIPAFARLFPGAPDILIRLPAALVAIFVSLWLCMLIEYYIPELVGIFSKDIIAGKESAR